MITWIVTDTATGLRIAAGSHTDRTSSLLDATAALRRYLTGAGDREYLSWIVTLDGELAIAGAAGRTDTGTADIATALEHLDLTTAQLTGRVTLYPHP